MNKAQIVAATIEDISNSLSNATLIGVEDCESARFFGEVLTEEKWIAQQLGLAERLVQYVAMYNDQ
jgi:hypothetical protein